MKRITPEQIAQAVAKTGLLLVKGEWGDGISCGCALTVLYLNGNPDCSTESFSMQSEIERADQIGDWSATEFGREYRRGFVAGFDGARLADAAESNEFMDGYDDGKQATEILQPQQI